MQTTLNSRKERNANLVKGRCRWFITECTIKSDGSYSLHQKGIAHHTVITLYEDAEIIPGTIVRVYGQ